MLILSCRLELLSLQAEPSGSAQLSSLLLCSTAGTEREEALPLALPMPEAEACSSPSTASLKAPEELAPQLKMQAAREGGGGEEEEEEAAS
jgi:hypothetical protein